MQESLVFYFMDPWNYLESVPLILILINVTRSRNEDLDPLFHRTQSLAALLLWFKFLYFLRSFKATAYLIRMLIEVCKDMSVFALVLLVTITGFADSFYSLSTALAVEEHSNYKPYITSLSQAF